MVTVKCLGKLRDSTAEEQNGATCMNEGETERPKGADVGRNGATDDRERDTATGPMNEEVRESRMGNGATGSDQREKQLLSTPTDPHCNIQTPSRKRLKPAWLDTGNVHILSVLCAIYSYPCRLLELKLHVSRSTEFHLNV